jgi:hypothetical protein
LARETSSKPLSKNPSRVNVALGLRSRTEMAGHLGGRSA